MKAASEDVPQAAAVEQLPPSVAVWMEAGISAQWALLLSDLKEGELRVALAIISLTFFRSRGCLQVANGERWVALEAATGMQYRNLFPHLETLEDKRILIKESHKGGFGLCINQDASLWRVKMRTTGRIEELVKSEFQSLNLRPPYNNIYSSSSPLKGLLRYDSTNPADPIAALNALTVLNREGGWKSLGKMAKAWKERCEADPAQVLALVPAARKQIEQGLVKKSDALGWIAAQWQVDRLAEPMQEFDGDRIAQDAAQIRPEDDVQPDWLQAKDAPSAFQLMRQVVDRTENRGLVAGSQAWEKKFQE